MKNTFNPASQNAFHVRFVLVNVVVEDYVDGPASKPRCSFAELQLHPKELQHIMNLCESHVHYTFLRNATLGRVAVDAGHLESWIDHLVGQSNEVDTCSQVDIAPRPCTL